MKPSRHLARNCLAARLYDATIAGMGKFKPARGKKSKTTAVPSAGLPCVIMLISGMFLGMLFLYFVMRNANG